MTMTPTLFKLTEQDRFLLRALAEREGTNMTGALRLALAETATARGINPSFVEYTSDLGDTYPVAVAVPSDDFERDVLFAFIEQAFARWTLLTVQLSRESVDEYGWWRVSFIAREGVDLLNILSQPSIDGRVCVLRHERGPLAWLDVPAQEHHPLAYSNPVSAARGLPSAQL